MSDQHSRRPVTVGVDGSECALRAVRWGAAEAARRGAPLRLVTAFGWLPERPAAHPTFRSEYREVLRGRAVAQLDTARAIAERAAQGVQVEAEVVVGSPYAVLAAEAREAGLLVVGGRGRSRLEGLLAGSVSVALAAHGPCPVVVVRGEERGADEEARLPVVVGVHSAATSEAAIAYAFDAAAGRGVELVAVHAWRDFTVPFGNWPKVSDEERQAMDERLDAHLSGWAQKHLDVPVRRVVARGRPAPCLLEHAQQAQLVVVGSNMRGELAGLVLGSVGNVLVHRSPCPVAVVRP